MLNVVEILFCSISTEHARVKLKEKVSGTLLTRRADAIVLHSGASPQRVFCIVKHVRFCGRNTLVVANSLVVRFRVLRVRHTVSLCFAFYSEL